MFVIHDGHRGDAQHGRECKHRTRPMGYSQLRPLPQYVGQELQRTNSDPRQLRHRMFAIVMSDAAIIQFHLVGELSHLEAIAGGEHDLVSSALQFRSNGPEERDMRRIIEINPDFFRCGCLGIGMTLGRRNNGQLPRRRVLMI